MFRCFVAAVLAVLGLSGVASAQHCRTSGSHSTYSSHATTYATPTVATTYAAPTVFTPAAVFVVPSAPTVTVNLSPYAAYQTPVVFTQAIPLTAVAVAGAVPVAPVPTAPAQPPAAAPTIPPAAAQK